ncbi:hypothetical protein ABG768_018784 [Culter alburnus]|uniref:RanBD1 domain-containing protein n=1 Tax=Culter alburnus TaxID=194366 RepID=A0AAW2AV29_CULAL
MRADDRDEEDDVEDDDVRDATYVPEDEGDNDEDSEDVNSSHIVFQEQSEASEQRVSLLSKVGGTQEESRERKASLQRPGGAVLDFEDFKNVIASSNSGKVNVVEMKSTNILAWRAGHSQVKIKNAPNLSGMAVIQLRRGSRAMYFKLSHDEEEFTQLNFLMKKVTMEYPKEKRAGDKGIEREKKWEIITKLCPMMPLNRRQFWENLAEEK